MYEDQENYQIEKWGKLRVFIRHYQDSKIEDFFARHTFSPELNLLDAGFEYIPKDFAIFTNNGKYFFNTHLLQFISPTIAQQLEMNPTLRGIHIDVDDPSNVAKKFEDMLQYSKVQILKSDMSVLTEIAFHLNLPEFTFLEQFALFVSPIYVQIDLQSFFLKHTKHDIFIISNNIPYRCNRFGICSSQVFKEFLQRYPTVESFQYDLDPPQNLAIIRNLFNYHTIDIDSTNIDFMIKMCDMLKIECIREKIEKLAKIYNTAYNSIDNKQNLCDSVSNLFESLYNIKDLTPAKVCQIILNSEWVATESNVIEMSSCLNQVIGTSIHLHPYIFELIFLLEKEANETNKLGIFLPHFKEQLLDKIYKSSHYCAFVYKLFARKVIAIDEIYTKMQIAFYNNDDCKLIKMLPFFMPEFFELAKNHQLDQIHLSKLKAEFKYSISECIAFRENLEPPDKLLRFILHDDIDGFQMALSHGNISLDLQISSNSLYFDHFSESNFEDKIYLHSFSDDVELTPSILQDYELTLIDFAAQNGAINCFKYLLLNHAAIEPSLLIYAIIGGNIEIFRIAYANVMNTYKYMHGPTLQQLMQNSLIQASRFHRYSIFDWLLSQVTNYMRIKLNDLIAISFENGNIEAVVSLLNKDWGLPKYIEEYQCTHFAILMSNGYVHFSKFFLSLTNRSSFPYNFYRGHYHIDSIVNSQNPSMLYLFENLKIKQVLFLAIRNSRCFLVDFIFKNYHYDKEDEDYFSFYYYSVQAESSNCFKQIISRFPLASSKPYLDLSQYIQLLEEASKRFNLETVKELTELVMSIDRNVDFTKIFLKAANNNYVPICNYFIHQKVNLDLHEIISQSSKIRNDITYELFVNTTRANQIIYFYEFLIKYVISNDSCNFKRLLQMDIRDLAINSILRENTEGSPFVVAIQMCNLDVINLFIDYFGEEISQLTDQINSGLRLILTNISQYNLRPFIEKESSDDEDDETLDYFEVFQRLVEVAPNLDMNICVNNRSFLSLAIYKSNLEFITFYLSHLSDSSVFNGHSPNSPLIQAILDQNLDIINLFIDFLDSKIGEQTENILSGLRWLLGNLNYPFNTSSHEMSAQILQRLATVVDIDLNFTCKKDTFLTFAMKKSLVPLARCVLENMKKRGQLDEVSPTSPLVYAISTCKYQFIDLIIEVLGKDIANQTKQINFGLQSRISTQDNALGCKEPFSKTIQKFVDTGYFDLHSLPVVDSLLKSSIQASDVEFLKIYLNTLPDKSLLKKTTCNSLLIQIITSVNFKLLTIFIDFMGDDIKDLVDQANLGLQLLLDPIDILLFKHLSPTKIFQTISTVTSLQVDSNPRFLTFLIKGIQNCDLEFVTFYLNNITDPSILDERSPLSPFVIALRGLNIDIVNSFIEYFNPNIDKHKDQIDLALQLILEDLCGLKYSDPDKIQTKFNSFSPLIERLLEVIDIDLDYCFARETFVTIAVSAFNTRFVELYLKRLKNPSILLQKSNKSPFIKAIVEQNYKIIDLFIQYFGESIVSYKDQIEFGLKLIFDDLGKRYVSVTRIVEQFVDAANIDINKQYGKETFLSVAVKNHDLAFIRFFLETKPRISSPDKASINSPLVLAIRSRYKEIIDLFLKYYGDDLVNHVGQINLALQLILEDLYNLSNSKDEQNLLKTGMPSYSIDLFFKLLKSTIKQLSTNQHLIIDWDCSYEDETFLTLAMKHSQTKFLRFYLSTIKNQAFLSHLNCSPLAYAIRQLNFDFIIMFIYYFGKYITFQTDQINLGFYLVLQDLCTAIRSKTFHKSHTTSVQYQLVAVRNVAKHFSKLVQIDLDFSFHDEAFLKFAKKQSNLDFGNFYLENLANYSKSKEPLNKSPFIKAIKELNLEIINSFLESSGDRLYSAIQIGLRLLLKDMVCAVISKKIPDIYSNASNTFNQVLKRLSEFSTIDFNYSFENETFLTLAIKMSNCEFIKFYLENSQDHSLLKQKSIKSPLVCSIQEQASEILTLIINFLGETVVDYEGIIGFGIEYLLKKSTSQYFPDFFDVLKRLLNLTTIDLSYSYNNKTIITVAIENSNIDFVKFYLDHLRDKSVLDELSETSPFICAIRSLQFDVINLVVDYLSQDITYYTDHINLALNFILIDLCASSNKSNKSNYSFTLSKEKPLTDNIFSSIQKVIQRFSNIVDIDLNCTCDNQTFLTLAIQQSQCDFVKFYLQFNKHSSIIHPTSPLAYAITKKNLHMINVLIDFYGDEIQSHAEEIKYGIQLLLDNLHMFGGITSDYTNALIVLKRFSKIVEIDLNGRFDNKTILAQAIKKSEKEFVDFYLHILNDQSIFYDLSSNSLFITAILHNEIGIIDLLIQYFGDKISIQNEQINLGIEKLLTTMRSSGSLTSNSSQVMTIIRRFEQVDGVDLTKVISSSLFLEFAIATSELDLIQFHLDHIKDRSIFQDTRSNSLFVITIRSLNISIIDLFIDFLGDDIANQTKQIHLALSLIFKERQKCFVPNNSPNLWAQQYTIQEKFEFASFTPVLKRLSQFVKLDLNCIADDDQTFLNYAIIYSNDEFIDFYIEHLKDFLSSNDLYHAPLVLAIQNHNLKLLNAIIDYLLSNDDIKDYMDQIDLGLLLLFHSLQKISPNEINSAVLTIQRLSETTKCNLNKYYGGDTLLTISIQMGHIDIAKVLIQNETVDVNLCSQINGNSPLMLAIILNKLEIAEILIECPRTNLNMTNYENRSVLALASSCNFPLFHVLYYKLREILDADQLNYAFYLSDDAIAQVFLDSSKLNVNYRRAIIPDSTTKAFAYESALIHSIKNDQYVKTLLILAHPQFDPIQSNVNDAIFLSIEKGIFDIFDALLKYVDVNAISRKSETLVEYCCRYKFSKAVDRIINDDKFDIEKSKFKNLVLSMLHGPADEDNIYDIELLKKLIEFDENHLHEFHFDQLLPSGKSFFTHIIVSCDLDKTMNYLSEDKKQKLEMKRTSFCAFIRFLLEKGVDPNKPDAFGVYPFQYAITNRIFLFVNELIQSGTIDYSMRKINIDEIKNGTYLHLAAFSNLTIVKKLVSLGVFDISMTDDLQQTPLSIASEKAQIDKSLMKFSDASFIFDYLSRYNTK